MIASQKALLIKGGDFKNIRFFVDGDAIEYITSHDEVDLRDLSSGENK